ncbi:type II toxin-antitoxin system Phd/YefM family antitoxin [Paractinoplanes atraurantiacus]|uniref:Prevent-host-death family protein n=1 Tax=Paractinoplanes atraurantiacus TaxID=1036182 RepID=A0A285K7P6_9ACTN|nr:type II toxin-antitoxin system Phd/YefM family antitoxin [Actinoplanes atraurantiacus]SNY68595.1 prevent-host-death family protein [Actinoplanes atraurantiacus]
MAQPAAFSPSDHDFEVSVHEARTRFVQLVRVASLTGRPVTITDHGRPTATIVPLPLPHQRNAPSHPPGPGSATGRPPDGTSTAPLHPPGAAGATDRTQAEDARQVEDARRRAEAERQAGAEAERRHAETFRQAEAARQQSDPDRAQAVAAGWARRLEEVRAAQQRRHAAEMAALAQALADAWRVIDHLRPRGADTGIDRLRTEHHDFLPDRRGAGGQSM